jgi:hypothetical protein
VPIVVCGLGGQAASADLPASVPGDRRLGGGERSLHELAVAIAATGREVELRGRVSTRDLAQLAAAAGAGPRADLPTRRPRPDDVVIVPEGYQRPAQYARICLSEARRILLLLGPPGLIGWPFVRDRPGPPDPLTVSVDAVARPEHFRAMDAAGFELWAHTAGMARAVRGAGVPCTNIGVGTPAPFPEPGPRTHELAWVERNRWAPLARGVVERLDARALGIPEVPHDGMIRLLGSSRLLVWPSRVEGQARIQVEARAMGTVPVALASNPFADGLEEARGAVTVDSLDSMVEAIRRLLADQSRIQELSRRAREWARAHVSWPDYVKRVDRALPAARSVEPTAEARALMRTVMDEELQRTSGAAI